MRKKAEEDLRKTKNENEKKNIYSFLNSSFIYGKNLRNLLNWNN